MKPICFDCFITNGHLNFDCKQCDKIDGIVAKRVEETMIGKKKKTIDISSWLSVRGGGEAQPTSNFT